MIAVAFGAKVALGLIVYLAVALVVCIFIGRALERAGR